MTSDLICIYIAAKIVTGNQSKAHLNASFERIGSKILRLQPSFDCVILVQGLQQLATREQSIHHSKSSTDQEHICYMVAMVWPCCPSVSAQLFFQTGGRDGGPEARVPPARPVLQQQRSPQPQFKCHGEWNQVRWAHQSTRARRKYKMQNWLRIWRWEKI